MNPDNEHNYFSALNNVRLSAGEKSRMRALLKAHTLIHPPAPAFVTLVVRHALGTSIAALLLLVGGTSVLAHRSMPDGFFYPLKLAVSDRVALVIAGDDEQRMDAELAQIERILRDEEWVADALFDDEEEHERKSESAKQQKDREYEDLDDELDDIDNELDDIDDDEISDFEDEDKDRDDDDGDKDEKRSDRPTPSLNPDAVELRALDAELKSIGSDLEDAEEDELEE